MAQTAQGRLSSRIGEAALAASAAAGAAMIAPPLALLILAALAARAFASDQPAPRIRVAEIAPPLVVAALVGAGFGLAAGIGMIFVWRILADTRWSMAESARLHGIAGLSRSRLARAHLIASPALGLAMVAFTAPHMVAGLPLDLPHIPDWAAFGVAAFAAIALFDWGLRCAAEWRLGSLSPACAAHEAAHHLIFLLAYAAAQDVSAGLVALIAWRLAHVQPRAAARPA